MAKITACSTLVYTTGGLDEATSNVSMEAKIVKFTSIVYK